MNTIAELRRTLHRNPELSGSEVETARRIEKWFAPLRPDTTVRHLGGNGVAFVFSGSAPGRTVLLRCELDALPIQETNRIPHRSIQDGVSHKCGHDGHMATLAAVGKELSANRPENGRVVLLYQPAEETGEGASAVLRDPRFAELEPDFAFAFHNVPGFPLGEIVVRSGAMTAASRGMAVSLTGVTAHAAQPETGVSPAAATCRIIERLSQTPDVVVRPDEMAFVTVVGARLGEKAFGTAPGHAEIWATLRSETDDAMSRLVGHAEQIVDQCASAENLQYEIAYEDVFRATTNSHQAVDLLLRSAEDDPVEMLNEPFRWSEDFGEFATGTHCALFGIGAGTETPDLHNPGYDFPDELIPRAATILLRIVRQCLA